jgi:hypothetical protein
MLIPWGETVMSTSANRLLRNRAIIKEFADGGE